MMKAFSEKMNTDLTLNSLNYFRLFRGVTRTSKWLVLSSLMFPHLSLSLHLFRACASVSGFLKRLASWPQNPDRKPRLFAMYQLLWTTLRLLSPPLSLQLAQQTHSSYFLMRAFKFKLRNVKNFFFKNETVPVRFCTMVNKHTPSVQAP